jgi:predicted SnoaL-like aldol condensation-catalyzing enzyme
LAAADRRQAAVSFLGLASSGKVREAFDTYVATGFVHHNPFFPGGPDALRAGMEANATKFPHKVFEIHHTLEDGDLVAVHSRVRMNPGEAGVAVVHIFRFPGDRIAELWDIGQPVPQDSPNQAGMF